MRAAIRPETRLIWAETPTNPYLKIVDIRGVAELLRDHPALFVVDNTFASPYLQNPLALGADLVLHSTTKYLGGHSDVVGGAVVGNDPGSTRRSSSIRTRPARCRGRSTAGWCCVASRRWRCGWSGTAATRSPSLSSCASIRPCVRSSTPGWPDHPGHDVAARQMRDFSGMVSFTVRGDFQTAAEVARSTRIFQLAESLGGVESLIEHPGQMTHASVAGTQAEVEDTLLRLSVGIENEDDLVGDLKQALEVVVPATAIGNFRGRAADPPRLPHVVAAGIAAAKPTRARSCGSGGGIDR